MCARADTAGEGFALDRRQASSHRYCTWLEAGALGVGAGFPAIGRQTPADFSDFVSNGWPARSSGKFLLPASSVVTFPAEPPPSSLMARRRMGGARSLR
ncbi:hypothetical protein C1X73_05380 [Pseudomonas sp. FW305-130]|nr:hypothetical protein C1X73_05380 [Pseudomonas sp. FW305-130]